MLLLFQAIVFNVFNLDKSSICPRENSSTNPLGYEMEHLHKTTLLRMRSLRKEL